MHHFCRTIATAKPSLAANVQNMDRKNRGKLRLTYAPLRVISETANLVDCVVRDAVRSEPVCGLFTRENGKIPGKIRSKRVKRPLSQAKSRMIRES